MNNVVAYCALLAAAVAAVTAYNFEDPEFNQILAHDLEDVYDSYSSLNHPRVRRDEEAVSEKDKCRRKRGKFCCADDLMDEILAKDKEFKRGCFKEIVGKEKPDKFEFDPFRCDKADKRRKEMTCILQCVGQKRNLLDSDGNVKEEEFGSLIKEIFGKKSWLTPQQDKVISTCLAEAKNATTHRDASDSTSCNPTGTKLAHCLFREIQLNCPADEIKDPKWCSKLQERMKHHDDFMPPPPPPGDEPDN